MAPTFGGTMRLNAAGKAVTMRGTFKLDSTNVEISDGTNQNGTVYFSFKPNAYGAEVTLQSDPGLSADTLVRMRGTFVIVEDDTGVVHTFSDAGWSGKLSDNREDGEISGLTIRASRYARQG
ncbi:hypothetical protein EYW49_20565 [Siculibacillus lacustris]|uniref:Uncharacterized protein n=1 Tax=Siculibacillus lacustris TaxID=1549641 RepID=A0A4Q9VGQ4_9HYPH|nr:phage tail tube protein [Siculibacillus lacustris]TBW33355.1 hypothetical protein EYW49_20565 [Siculibacillus lacustris]